MKTLWGFLQKAAACFLILCGIALCSADGSFWASAVFILIGDVILFEPRRMDPEVSVQVIATILALIGIITILRDSLEFMISTLLLLSGTILFFKERERLRIIVEREASTMPYTAPPADEAPAAPRAPAVEKDPAEEERRKKEWEEQERVKRAEAEAAYWKAIAEQEARRQQAEARRQEAEERKAQREARREAYNEWYASTERGKREARKQAAHDQGIACCPKCGSTSLTANKKGFGIGKAVAGFSVAGSYGLVAGNINSKKVTVTCLYCGHQFKPGKK